MSAPACIPRDPADTLRALAKFMGLYGFTVYEGASLLHQPVADVEKLLARLVRGKVIADSGDRRALGGPRPAVVYIPYTYAPLESHHA